MTEPTPRDQGIARAFVALSGAVLDLGAAIAGGSAVTAALGEPWPPEGGPDDDDDRDGADDGPWVCPLGAADDVCRLTHDHYPAPRRRRHGEG